MAKIDLSSLRPVEITDRARFDKALKIMGSQSCEACFPNIFMYREPYGIEFIEIEERLVVYERQTRIIHYPLGEPSSPEFLHAVSKAFQDAGLTDGGIYDVPEDFLDAHYESCIRIPMRSQTRSLNLSNAVAITVFEALRQLDFPHLQDYGKMAK